MVEVLNDLCRLLRSAQWIDPGAARELDEIEAKIGRLIGGEHEGDIPDEEERGGDCVCCGVCDCHCGDSRQPE